MRRALAAAVLVGVLALPAGASAITYAPVDQPGPPLSVRQSELDAALVCNGDLAGGSHAPVLLVPGTAETPVAEFSWNWESALNGLGIPWCTIALPQSGTGDIQTAAEYVVDAIRSMHARAGRPIGVVGHSQGGMLPRWVPASGPTPGRWSTTWSAWRPAITGRSARSPSASRSARRPSGSRRRDRSSARR